MPKTLTPPA